MGSQYVREEVLKRDCYKCQICGTKGSLFNKLTMHHIIFRSHGGKYTVDNLVTWCQRCHRAFHKEYDSQHKSCRKKRGKKGRMRC